MGEKVALEVVDVCAAWKKQKVLENINLKVEKGELLCLSGPNGAGKSTLLTVMSGIDGQNLKKTGTVLIDGKDIKAFNRKALSTKLSYLTQKESCLWNYSVQEQVLMGRFCHTNSTGFYSEADYKVTDDIIKRVQIESLRNKKIFELSGGEFQKVRIARCLAQESDYLLLDEPVANLDFTYQDQLLNLLKELAKEKNIGIAVSIHDLNTAVRFADKMALLPRQKPCFTGTVDEVMVTDLLEKVYEGQRFGTFIHPEYKCLQMYTL